MVCAGLAPAEIFLIDLGDIDRGGRLIGRGFVPERTAQIPPDKERPSANQRPLLFDRHRQGMYQLVTELADHKNAGGRVVCHLLVDALRDEMQAEERRRKIIATQLAGILNRTYALLLLRSIDPQAGNLRHGEPPLHATIVDVR